ncbi:MAG: hypothetical protein AB1445_01500 [Bacillota bacterium]
MISPKCHEVLDGVRLVHAALDHAAAKLNLSRAQASARINQKDVEASLYFRYALAKECALLLGHMDHNVKGGFLALENRWDGLTSEPVCLGLVVTRKTAALSALADSVTDAATSAIQQLLPAYSQVKSVLHIEIVDDQDVSKKAGLAALIGSLHEPPLWVWP